MTFWPFKKKSVYELPPLPPLKADIEHPPVPPTKKLDLPTFKKVPKSTHLPDITPPKQPPPLPTPDMGPIEGINLWLSNGVIVTSLETLLDALRAMRDATFHYHVNVEHNDIASWISDVLGDHELAMRLSHVHKRADFINVLEKHLGQPIHKKVKKHAYMGLRGEATSIHPEPEKLQINTPINETKEDAISLISRLEPKGTMLKELLEANRSKKKQPIQEFAEKPTIKKQITPSKGHGLWLGENTQSEPTNQIQETRATVTKPLLTHEDHFQLPALRKAPKPKPIPPHEEVKLKIEEAKQHASMLSVKQARTHLREAKSIVKEKLDKDKQEKMKYALWDAENAIKLATLK